MSDDKSKKGLTYADAGVDISAGEEAVDRIKSLAKSTFNENVLSGIGSFGGCFRADFGSIKKPVLISSTDSVGTKLKIPFMTGKHDTVGEDLINHCVDDILVMGARPLFFLDYIGIGKLDPSVVEQLVEGLARGCRNVNMALVGGETAELTDLYQPGEYDLAGFIVGVVDEDRTVNGSAIRPGDVCLGLPSNGLHTNGYTLARKVAFEIAGLKHDDHVAELGMTIAEALMQVHICYAPVVLPLLDKYDIHGMAHITGGGIPGNLVRVLPDNCCATIDKSTWPNLPIFEYLKKAGGIDADDIYSALNMGIGYILVVPEAEADSISDELKSLNQTVYRIGQISTGDKKVTLI